MSSNARVVLVTSIEEARRLMKQMDVHPEGVDIMAPKTSYRVVKLENVDVRAANILKQEILSRGGEAAVSWSVYALAKNAKSDVLLMGTARQFDELGPKLKRQPFGLARIADEIREALANFDASPGLLTAGKLQLNIGAKTHVMGILNVTPDSFSDAGRFMGTAAAVEHGLRMIEDGADMIDVGGESTRPGAQPVEVDQELERVIPVVRELAKAGGTPISIDTYKAEVARQALDAGASVVNDVSALRFDADMGPLLAEQEIPVVLMHMLGTPQNMQQKPRYVSVLGEVISFLRERIRFAVDQGIKLEHILIDPGIGFGKNVEHNLEILRKLAELKTLGHPIVVGTSRKSFIGDTLDLPVEERLEGTAATVALVVSQGASIVRVHDVKAMTRVAKMIDAIVGRGRQT